MRAVSLTCAAIRKSGRLVGAVVDEGGAGLQARSARPAPWSCPARPPAPGCAPMSSKKAVVAGVDRMTGRSWRSKASGLGLGDSRPRGCGRRPRTGRRCQAAPAPARHALRRPLVNTSRRPGRRSSAVAQPRVLGDAVEGDVVHRVQEGLRLDIMMDHQTRQGGARARPVLLLHRIGGHRVEARAVAPTSAVIRSSISSMKPSLSRIEGVVEIEQPGVDVAQIRRTGSALTPGSVCRRRAR